MFDGIAATLPAGDMSRVKAFYREKLELSPEREEPDGSARYRLGDTTFLVYPSQFAGTNQATAAAFAVADLEGAVGTLRNRGVAFEEYDFGELKTVDGIVTMPDGSKGAWFKDTEGNIVGLFQEA
jgi:predicted enzyme related to lactoylglutathione lyase